MEFRQLDYQQHVLKLLDVYLAELVTQKAKAATIEKKLLQVDPNNPDTTCFITNSILDFPLHTWKKLKERGKLPSTRSDIPNSPRPDGVGRPVPNIVYKVPTAGGKTYLAIASIAKIFSKYLGKQTGFVLWVVPNETIYTQTKKKLSDRRHPYRQLLDNLSGNAVKIMEKTTPLNANDVADNLCVMILMLQSSNRQNQASLKIFQERGDVRGFTPEEGNQKAHKELKREIRNLDMCDLTDSSFPWMPVRDSLGNALRVIRPVVVLDEGHKAVSHLAFKTLYDFNPCFVLELTATPKDVKKRTGSVPHPGRYQNILADISGVELDREGMIKVPINLDARKNADWRSVLASALQRLNDLDKQAKYLMANQNRYIRPILLVQVERTGKDQRDGQHIHAEDVKDWLTDVGNLYEAEVAIKTSNKNDLKAPENQNLLSETNRIRVIITKQALQEGWDCSFAYVLCSLALSHGLSAMTQLTGRILRQPHAKKTGIDALDECYVITRHAATGTVIKSIKDGLEKTGMGDLSMAISLDAPDDSANIRQLKRNPKFANDQIFLPKVLRVAGTNRRELDYEEDILFQLDWRNLDLDVFIKNLPKTHKAAERQLHQISLGDSTHKITNILMGRPKEEQVFDSAHAAQSISDIVLNAWVARDIIKTVVVGLENRGFNRKKLGKFSTFIIEQLRNWLAEQRDQLAERLFRCEVGLGHIQFRLRADSDNWEMPTILHSYQPKNSVQLPREDGQPMQRGLFQPVYQDDLNLDERHIAVYMDDVETLKWWHRNIARKNYFLQGWQRHKIYPDFICQVQASGDTPKLVVLEMKGDHLGGNADTLYKKAVMELMSSSFSVEHTHNIGEIELYSDNNKSVHCELVLMKDWETNLPDLLA